MDPLAILNVLESHALASGWFEQVNKHEPKSAPSLGLTAAIWLQTLDPLPEASGLASTSGRLVWTLRQYQNALYQPPDAIDPNMLLAADALFTAYSGDFELGGTVRNIDLLGAHGTSLRGQAGYLNQDGKLFRVFDISIPVIVNDLWSQSG
jgi:hypothetical protein